MNSLSKSISSEIKTNYLFYFGIILTFFLYYIFHFETHFKGYLIDYEYFGKYTALSNGGLKQFFLMDHNYIPFAKRLPSYLFYTFGVKDQYIGFAHSFYTIFFISLCSYCFTRKSFSKLVPSNFIRFIFSLTLSSIATFDTMLIINISYFFCIPLALYLVAFLYDPDGSTPLIIKIATPLFIISQPLLVSLFPTLTYCFLHEKKKNNKKNQWLFYSMIITIPFFVFYIYYTLFIRVSENQELKSLPLDSLFLLIKKIFMNLSYHYSKVFINFSQFSEDSSSFLLALCFGISLKMFFLFYSMKTKDRFLKYSLQVALSMIFFSSLITVTFYPWGIKTFYPFFLTTERHNLIQEVGVLIIFFSLLITLTKKLSTLKTFLLIICIGGIGSFRNLPIRWLSPSYSFKHISINTKINRLSDPNLKSCFSAYSGFLVCNNLKLVLQVKREYFPDAVLSKVRDDDFYDEIEPRLKQTSLQPNQWTSISYDLVDKKFFLYGLRFTFILPKGEHKNLEFSLKLRDKVIKKNITIPHKGLEILQVYYQFPEKVSREDLEHLALKLDKKVFTYFKGSKMVTGWTGSKQ